MGTVVRPGDEEARPGLVDVGAARDLTPRASTWPTRDPMDRMRSRPIRANLDVHHPARGLPRPPVRAVHNCDKAREYFMPSWLLLIVIGVVLLVLGVATSIGHFLIWVGVAVLVISLILAVLGRGRRTT